MSSSRLDDLAEINKLSTNTLNAATSVISTTATTAATATGFFDVRDTSYNCRDEQALVSYLQGNHFLHWIFQHRKTTAAETLLFTDCLSDK
jgi:hypothetical protein